MVDTINNILPMFVIIAQFAILALLVLLAVVLLQKKQNMFSEFISDNALWLAFIVALTATLGSLFYSEVMQYTPCNLCWWQRIFMYPQVILLGLAAWKKNNSIVDYSIVLSAIGAGIAAFHYYGQMIDSGILSCSTLGQTASCATLHVLEYGYVTIPLMSFSAFSLIALLMISKKLYNK